MTNYQRNFNIGEVEIDGSTIYHKTEYRDTGIYDLSRSPVPDYSGYSKKNLNQYLGGIVQTSRGCPFNCEFCDVIPFMGNKKRYRDQCEDRN